MVTAGGEEHGLINTITNHVPDDNGAKINPKVKSAYEKKRKDDAKIVKARLVAKNSNERLDKPYCRYAGDPINVYHLIPGYSYELPMGFIEEVNGIQSIQRSGLVSLDGENVTKDGDPLAKDKAAERQFELVPVSF